jgi:protein-tyrosine phosphatase
MKVFWVSKRLTFGSAITTWGHVDQLQALGITHVVNLRHGHHTKKVRQFKNLWLPFRDDLKPRPNWFHRRALLFYQKAIRRPKSTVLCMCHHGVSRSASLAYFLLRVDGFTPARAKSTVLKARPQARIVPAYLESGENFLSLHKMQQFIKGKRSKS